MEDDDADEGDEGSTADASTEEAPSEAEDAGSPAPVPESSPPEPDPEPELPPNPPSLPDEPPAVEMPPDAGSSVAPSPDGGAAPVEEVASPRWLYVAAPERALINLAEPSQRFENLQAFRDSFAGVAPWSSDGRLLVNVENELVRIFDLQDGGQSVLDANVGPLPQVLRWVGNDYVLLTTSDEAGQGAVLLGVDGSQSVALAALPDTGVVSHSASPNGNSLFFSLTAAEGFPFQFVDSTDRAVPSLPQLIDTHPMSPALSMVWSSDSRWMAYGVSGQTSGIYVWSAPTGPVQVSPEGTSYTPLYSFSPRGDGLVVFAGAGETGSVLLHVELGDTIGATTELGAAGEQSPAVWSAAGNYVSYANAEGGLLRPVGPGGAIGEPIDFPEYGFSCPLFWVNDDEFISGTCADGVSGNVRWGSVVDGALQFTPMIAGPVSFTVGGTCLVVWDQTTLQTGVVSPSPTLTDLTTSGEGLEWVLADPDGEGVIWRVGGTRLYWQALADCAPLGEPVPIDLNGTVQEIEFVAD